MITDFDKAEVFPNRITVVGVKVRDSGEVKQARTSDASLQLKNHVMLEYEEDLTYGTVYVEPRSLPFMPPMRVMKSVFRKATWEDEQAISRHQSLAEEGKGYCRERAVALGIRMKLVEVYGSFRKRILTFCYTAHDRVDFRELVKDLARRFCCRIEMRQISNREEARRVSGVDTCGLVLCCSSFLTDFAPLNLKDMQDNRALSAESHRLGVCGRLKCCLMFESDEWNSKLEEPQLILPSHRS